MKGSLCVRKGAWSKVEDDLLRACVQQYGEGKWHLVPTRAGLNRCRKSCRLRWLNYLKPNINRGEFTEDEIDMMQRLHKLLGNRWSLIAGRLCGRTANDVKNYWNTCVRRKAPSHKVVVSKEKKEEKTIKPHVVIKPRARTISRSSPLRDSVLREGHEGGAKQSLAQACEASLTKSNNWWETVMDDKGGNIDQGNPYEVGNMFMEDINCDHNLTSFTLQGEDFLIEGENYWSDFLLDSNLLDL